MKVKLFESHEIKNIEASINTWLDENPDILVSDRYQTVTCVKHQTGLGMMPAELITISIWYVDQFKGNGPIDIVDHGAKTLKDDPVEEGKDIEDQVG